MLARGPAADGAFMQVMVNMGTVSPARGAAPEREKPALLDLEELLATRLLVQGNSGSGKSHLLRRLLEQSTQWVQQCVIDPEGDFITLADKFGHVVVEASRTAEELARIAARIRRHRVSCVLNLEGLEAENQMRAASAFLNGLFEAERDCWYPMLAVVDEAQLFAPSGAVEVSEEARRNSLSAMTNLMCRGRKRGLAGVIATQRLAKLAKNVAAEASNFLMGRTFLDIDMARAADLLGMERRQAEAFRDLARGQFIALGPALSRRPLAIKIGPVETSARSSSPKLMPLPEVEAEAAEELIFTAGAEEPASRPQAKPPFGAVAGTAAIAGAGFAAAEAGGAGEAAEMKPLGDVLEEVESAGAAKAAAEEIEKEETLFPEIDESERKELLWQIIGEILAEPQAFYQPVAALYQDFTVRCRIHRLKGKMPDLAEFRRILSYAQAGINAELAANPLWPQACAMAESVAEDVRGILLKLAAAAIAGAPCPPDATLARLYGTASARRAHSLLKFFEERGLLVARTDFTGKRIIAFPGLGAGVGIETAPGSADAPDSPDPVWDGKSAPAKAEMESAAAEADGVSGKGDEAKTAINAAPEAEPAADNGTAEVPPEISLPEIHNS